jgi:hypothetical protein
MGGMLRKSTLEKSISAVRQCFKYVNIFREKLPGIITIDSGNNQYKKRKLCEN